MLLVSGTVIFLLSLSAINTLAELLLATTVVAELREKALTENDSLSSNRSSSTIGIVTHSRVSPRSKVRVDVKGRTSKGRTAVDRCKIQRYSVHYTVSFNLAVVLTLY